MEMTAIGHRESGAVAALPAASTARLPSGVFRLPRRYLWTAMALFICVPTLIPIGATLAALMRPDAETWNHLLQYVLPHVSGNTLWLLAGVGLGSAVLGTGLAALVALCEFPGRRWFGWALLLPLAMPAYVLAVAAISLFDYAGPVQTALRGIGLGFPEFRSRWGVILVMTLALYPYVYLVARQAFASQGARALEAARALGCSPLRAFFSASLPLAWPWIAAGTLLVLMETLADFGTVAAFNYDTFTVAIYKAWFAMFSVDAALQIASVLLLVALVLLLAEARARRGLRFTAMGHGHARRLPLKRWRWAATGVCALVLLLAFALPVARLLHDALQFRAELDLRYARMAGNALLLGFMSAGLLVLAAMGVAYAQRRSPGWLTAAAARVATLGYALPGALLAVGLYVPLVAAAHWADARLGWSVAIHGSLVLLLLAYGVRFLAVAYAPVNAGLLRVRPSLSEAARTLGVGGVRLFARVHLPLLRGSLFTAALLVFVDVMKEMPITLMTRPFGWDTLATRVFELTSEGEWGRAAWPSLGIVVAGLVPVYLLNRGAERATAA
jgi:iron(III) transport system permease protein